MTRPETCDAAGGAAISLWLRLIDCPDWAGVISSRDSGSGFVLHCRNHNNREQMRYDSQNTQIPC